MDKDDIERFAAATLTEPDRFTHRSVDIGGEALTVEQMASAISEVSGREIVVDHISRNRAERMTLSNPQIDAQLWFWERQDRFGPQELEADFRIKFTNFKVFLTTNNELARQAFGYTELLEGIFIDVYT